MKLKKSQLINWGMQIAIAFILLQTLYFKFSGAPESKYIFETLGMEPWGRIGSGIVELIAAILILIPASRVIGAIMSLGIISGAIFFHLTTLGIEVKDDGGLLFFLAVIVFILSLFLIVFNKAEIPIIGNYFSIKKN